MRRRMQSKFPGVCVGCGRPFPAGEAITWERPDEPLTAGRKPKGRAYHDACAPAPDGATPGGITHTTAGGTTVDIPADDEIDMTAGTEPTPDVIEARPSCNDAGTPPTTADPAMEALARGLMPIMERAGFARGTRDNVLTRTHVIAKRPDGTSTTIPDAHPQFASLLTMVEACRNVYTHGAPGAGKSYASASVAQALGLDYRYASLTPMAMPSLLTGYMDAQGRYVSTDFRHVYEHGGVFAIDEADNANANLLASLNSALANGLASFPDGMIARHPDCVVIATGNTPGMGPTIAFPERRPLDRAFRDRFAFLAWTYAPEHERTIARGMLPDFPDAADAWAQWVHAVRAYCATDYPALTCSPRAIYSGVAMLGRGGLSLRMIADAALFQGIEGAVASKILAACPMPAIKVKP